MDYFGKIYISNCHSTLFTTTGPLKGNPKGGKKHFEQEILFEPCDAISFNKFAIFTSYGIQNAQYKIAILPFECITTKQESASVSNDIYDIKLIEIICNPMRINCGYQKIDPFYPFHSKRNRNDIFQSK